MQRRNEPYVGPRPFEKEEHKVFFGRDMEADELTALITAHPVVLLYAQSGAGKTSLVKAGLIPKLVNDEQFDVVPPARVREQITSTVPFKEIKNIFMFNALMGMMQDEIVQDKREGKEPLPPIEQAELAQMSFADYLRRRREFMDEKQQHLSEESMVRMPTIIFFDQFEEFFTFYSESWAQRKGFFEQLDEALDADPLLRVVFSMREDFIAEMDPYAPILPEKLRTRFRMERLRERNALEAVKKPLVASELNKEGRTFAPGVAEQLVTNLLMRRVRISPQETEEIKGEYVEPLQLQVVCQNLWQKLKPEDKQITSEHLKAFGDVNQALSQFYEACVKEAAAYANIPEAVIRGWVDRVLITPENTRATVLQRATDTGGLPNKAVEVLERKHLLRVEMRDDRKWYELSHDRFIPPIQESYKKWLLSQTGYEQLKQGLEEKAAIWNQGDKKDPALLLSRAELPQAVRWIESPEAAGIGYSPTLLAYVTSSRAAISEEDNKRQQRRTRLFRGGLIAASFLLLLTLASTAFALVQYREASAKSKEAVAALKIAEQQTRVSEIERVNAYRERLNAEAQAKEAEAQRKEADVQRKEAEDQKIVAEKAVAAVNVEKVRADAERRKAEQQKQIAEAATKDALQQKAVAQQAAALAKEAEGEAKLAKAEARSREWAANSRESLGDDPEKSVRLALSAVREWNTQQAGYALRRALMQVATPRAVIGDEGLTASALSPDGRFVITTTETGKIHRWDTDSCASGNPCTPTEVRAPQAGSDYRPIITDVAFSPNGELFVTADDKGRVLMWDARTGAYVAELKGHTASVGTLMFGRTGKYLATGSEDKTARIWNVEACKSAQTCKYVELKGEKPHDAGIYAIAFSADDKIVATEAGDKTGKVWNAETGDLINTFTGLSGEQSAIALSPDGKLVAAEAGKDPVDGRFLVKVWVVGTQTELTTLPTTLKSHTDTITAVAFDERGQYILTASADKTVRVWKRYGRPVAGQAPIFLETSILRGHDGGITSAQFSQSESGLFVLTASQDKTARVWDAITGRNLFVLRGHKSGIKNAAFSKDRQRILTTAEDSTVLMWDSKFGQNVADYTIAELTGHRYAVTDAVFSPDSKTILTTSADGSARLWNATTGQFSLSLTYRTDQFRTGYKKAAFNTKGDSFAVVAEDGKVRIWKWAKLGTAFRWVVNNTIGDNRILNVAFVSDKRIVTANENKTVEIWEEGEKAVWKRIATIEGHGGAVNSVALNANGSLMVTASADGTARVWKQTGGKWQTVAELKGHSGAVNSAAFCPGNDKLIVTAGADYMVRVWEEKNDGVWGEATPPLHGHDAQVLSAAFNRDGEYIISVSEDRTARVWKKQPGGGWQPSAVLMESKDALLGVSFRPDGKYLVTASADGKARIYSELMFAPLEEVKNLAQKRGFQPFTEEELKKETQFQPPGNH